MSIQIRTIVCGDIQENAYLAYVEGRDDCVLVDPGDDYIKLRDALGPRRLAAILLTHGHFDHNLATGRLARDTGAPVYAAREDMEMLNDPRINGLGDLMDGFAMPGPAIEAEPFGEKLSAAGMEFEIIPTPGHTRGSVCLRVIGEDVLFTGDTLFRAGFGRMDLHGGSERDMMKSLMKLFGLPPELKVWPGHGMPTTIGEERSRYRL